jgi:UDP-N-acetylmuramoyl-L-alanyl-D-glutamate--2,6-diaminopimelate ligase
MSSQATSKSLGALASATHGIVRGDAETLISDVVYDSRHVTPGSLFAALPGGYADGHTFIDQAIERGASALLVERDLDYAVPSIVVDDSRAALSPLAAAFFDYPTRDLRVVGVTGTDGKTSTSTLAEAIFAGAGLRTGLIGTVQIKIGNDVIDHETRQTTPESLDIQRLLRTMVDNGVNWAFLEATSHGLAMHRLDDIQFSIAAVTNITHEHLDYHGSREAYWAAKRRLFELVRTTGGKAVVNLDDEGSRTALDVCERADTITYSAGDTHADLVATNIVVGRAGFSAQFTHNQTTTHISSPLLGGFNVSNSLCAAGIALQAGIPMDAIARTLGSPPTIAGRMARIDEGQSFNVVVDYAHTPASLEKVLTLLRSLDDSGRIIVVTGSAGERDVEKRPLQGRVCIQLADVSIFTNEDPRFESGAAIINDIAAGARLAGGTEGASFFAIEDRQEAIQHAIDLAQPGDTILLAGKGHERSIILNGKKLPWDEAERAREAIRRRLNREAIA